VKSGAAFLILLLTSCICLAQRVPTTAAAQIQFSATADRNTYKAGARIKLHLELINGTDRTILIPGYFLSTCEFIGFFAEFFNEQGQLIKTPVEQRSCIGFSLDEQVGSDIAGKSFRLLPGKSISHEDSLSLNPEILKPGRYRLFVSFGGWSSSEIASLQPQMAAKFISECSNCSVLEGTKTVAKIDIQVIR
jgi:hypothetical protein